MTSPLVNKISEKLAEADKDKESAGGRKKAARALLDAIHDNDEDALGIAFELLASYCKK
jgi:hypothetical protein